MANKPAKFNQVDLTRALKAAIKAGVKILRTEIGQDGTIRLIHSGEDQASIELSAESAFDTWKAQNARSA